MTALDKIIAKNRDDMGAIEFVLWAADAKETISKAATMRAAAEYALMDSSLKELQEHLTDECKRADALRVKLAALRKVAEAARPFSVMPAIEQKTVIDGRTFVSLEVSAVLALEAALKELEAVK